MQYSVLLSLIQKTDCLKDKEGQSLEPASQRPKTLHQTERLHLRVQARVFLGIYHHDAKDHRATTTSKNKEFSPGSTMDFQTAGVCCPMGRARRAMTVAHSRSCNMAPLGMPL